MTFSWLILGATILFWHVGFKTRIGLGFLLGFWADSLSIFPFGAYTFILILIAILSELLRSVFSNASSLFTKGVAIGIMVFITTVLIYPTARLISLAQGFSFPLSRGAEMDIIIDSLVWGLVIFIIFCLAHVWKIKRRRVL